MPEEPHHRNIRRLGLPVSSSLFFLVCAGLSFLVPDTKIFQEEVIVRNALGVPLVGFAFLGALACAVIAVVGFIKKIPKSYIALITAFLSPLILIPSAFINGVDTYTEQGKVVAPGGKEYCLLYRHFLQGTTLVIAELTHAVGPIRSYRVLVDAPWEDSFHYLRVVKPVGEMGFMKLFFTHERLLVCVVNSNSCHAAYDLKSGRSYGQGESKPRVTNHVDELSPFILLGPSDKPNQSDIAEMIDPYGFATPKKEIVERELRNPNPEVRKLASDLLNQLKTFKPKSTQD